VNDRVSPHFLWSEAACHATGEEVPSELHPQVIRLATGTLEPLRARWETMVAHPQLIVISWYRSPAYNAHIFALSQERARRDGREHGGVAQNSIHMTGGAIDIKCVVIAELRRLRDLALAMYEHGELPDLGGVGDYPGKWLHLDIHRVGSRLRRWGGFALGDEPR
jgi:uncharacterized protein YcbK (DUF882 family)